MATATRFTACTPTLRERTRRASVSISTNSKKGHLCRPHRAEMADAISAAGEIDSALCRREAESRFSSEGMIEKYVALYEQAARSEMSQPEELTEVLC